MDPPGTVARVGEYEVRLIGVKAESFFDGLNGSVNTSLSIRLVVACPATADPMALQRHVVLSALEDENGEDMLVRLTVPPESQSGFASHPFGQTHRVREPDGRIMFRRQTGFYAKDVRHLPRRISRIAGTAVVLRPKEITTFDFEATPGDAGSAALRELAPGLWLAISREDIQGARETTIYSWLCNRVPAEFERQPEGLTWAEFQTLSALWRNLGEKFDVGHDPSLPPAIVGIWEHREGGEPSQYFSLSDHGLRRSGIYSSATHADRVVKGHKPVPLRVAVATEFERVEVPFEFRDVPLSLSEAGE